MSNFLKHPPTTFPICCRTFPWGWHYRQFFYHIWGHPPLIFCKLFKVKIQKKTMTHPPHHPFQWIFSWPPLFNMEICRKMTSSWRNKKLPRRTTFKLSGDVPLHNVLPWWEYQVICGLQAEIMDVLRFWAWRRILCPNSTLYVTTEWRHRARFSNFQKCFVLMLRSSGANIKWFDQW